MAGEASFFFLAMWGLLPGTHRISLDSGQVLLELEQGSVPGLFSGRLQQPQAYDLHINWAGGEQVTEDPYSFTQLLLGEMDLYLFAEGNHRDLSACLGAQLLATLKEVADPRIGSEPVKFERPPFTQAGK